MRFGSQAFRTTHDVAGVLVENTGENTKIFKIQQCLLDRMLVSLSSMDCKQFWCPKSVYVSVRCKGETALYRAQYSTTDRFTKVAIVPWPHACRLLGVAVETTCYIKEKIDMQMEEAT